MIILEFESRMKKYSLSPYRRLLMSAMARCFASSTFISPALAFPS